MGWTEFGIPQESVLDPIYFCTIYQPDVKPPDDTIACVAIKLNIGAKHLQQDLQLAIRSGRWEITFHPNKCNVKKNSIKFSNIPYGHQIELWEDTYIGSTI